jgi:PDDEXK-like domain of unknown function (DUF3799)
VAEIAEPGVYPDVPMVEYLRDPVPAGSISASGIGLLVSPKAPAHFRAWADAPVDPVERGRSAAMDFGSVAHALVLNTDDVFITVRADDWRTKRAQDERKAIEAAGHIAVLERTAQRATELADVVQSHPVAGALFPQDDVGGTPEATLVWQDDEFGVWCRARLDRLPPAVPGVRMVIPDLKTCESAHPDACDAAIARYGYGRQGAHYRAGVRALGIDPDPAVVNVFVETRRPYLITVRQLGDLTDDLEPGPLTIGSRQVRRGLQIFADCQRTGEWPGYGNTIGMACTPSWAAWEFRSAEQRGDYEIRVTDDGVSEP